MILSIFIPIYNLDYSLIKRNFDSLNSQDNDCFDYFEAIIVDDGSNKKTKENISLLLKNARFNYKFISKENGGWGSAINFAIKNAKGKYGFYLDGDDEISKDFVKKFISFKLMNDKSIAYSMNSVKIGLNQTIDSETNFNNKTMIDLNNERPNVFSELPQLIVHMNLLKSIKIPEITWNADLVYFVLSYSNISKIYTINIWYIYHYLRPGNTNTSKITEKQFYDIEKAVVYLMDFKKNNDFAIRKYLYTLMNYARTSKLLKIKMKDSIKQEIYHYIKYKPFSIYHGRLFRWMSIFLSKKLILFLIIRKK